MGFDIYGQKARSQKGEYFRNNVWWWRGLWAFVCEQCHDLITQDQMLHGQFNDGAEFDEELALKIAERLEESIANKTAHAFSRAVKQAQMTAKKTNTGKKCGDDGYDWAEAYPFSVSNVREFAKFCRESGGFKIF